MSVKIDTKPGAQRMAISPETALQILEKHNTHNRPLSQRKVNDWAREMEKGNWRYNSADAIVFDKNLTVANGQHRLWAVVQSETTQEFLVSTGAEPEEQDIMDQQTKRTTAHQLALSGYTDAKHIAVIGRVYLQWKNGALTNQMQRPTTPDIRLWADSADKTALEFAIRTGTNISKLYPIRMGAAGSSAYAAYIKDSGAAEQFFNDLCEGVGLDKGHPVLTLSKYLQRQAINGTRFREIHQLWLIVSTWNHWRQGRQLGKIMSPSEYKNVTFPHMK